MKWDLHIYDPRSQTTKTVVRSYPRTTKADGAAVTAYASRDLRKPMKYILAVPHRGSGGLGLRGLGDVGPDARAAIQAARAGRCSTALKHLYDTSPHIQSSSPTAKHSQDFRIAAQIVNKLCAIDKKGARGKGRRYRTHGFDGARRRRRRR